MDKPQTISFTRITACAGSKAYGIWWFRIMGYGLVLKASWTQPLFFERYGYRKFLKLFGWRIGCLTP